MCVCVLLFYAAAYFFISLLETSLKRMLDVTLFSEPISRKWSLK